MNQQFEVYGFSDTVKFVDFIVKIWKIVNVKSSNKGKRFSKVQHSRKQLN